MTPVYELTAAECPALPLPSGVLDLASDTPLPGALATIVTGEKETGMLKVNRGLVAIEANGRFAGGAAAVCEGCDLEHVAGLNGQMSAGYVALDAVQCYAEAVADAFPNGLRTFVWIQQSGDFYFGSDKDDVPGPIAAFLGSVVTGGGTWATIDYSGRWSLGRGGLLYRRTADEAEPTDTPAAGTRFLTRTQDGLYLFDGEAYTRLDFPTTALSDALAALEAEQWEQGRLFRRFLLRVAGSPLRGLLDPDFAPYLIRAQLEAGH